MKCGLEKKSAAEREINSQSSLSFFSLFGNETAEVIFLGVLFGCALTVLCGRSMYPVSRVSGSGATGFVM